MKVIASSTIVDSTFENILSSLAYIGVDCEIWKPQSKSANDMLYEKRPDIIFVYPGEHTLTLDNVPKVFVGFNGTEPPEMKPKLWLVPENTPDNEFPNQFQFRKCANLAKYKHGKVKDDLKYDILYFSDVQPEFSLIKQLIAIQEQDVRFCAVGPIKLPILSYLGDVTVQERANLLASCEMGIDFFDINRMNFALFKKACGVTIEEVEHLWKNPKLRVKQGKNTYKEVMAGSTSFHITAEIFNQLGYKDIGEKCLASVS